MKKILLVDDNNCLLWSLSTWLGYCGGGFTVVTADTGCKALDILESSRPDLLITGLRLPDVDGLSFIRCVAASCAEIPVIALASYVDEEVRERMNILGACDYLLKPFKFDALLDKMYSCGRLGAREGQLVGLQ